MAHRWVCDGFGEPPATTARPHVTIQWDMAVHNTLLVGGSDHPPRAGKQVDPGHVWRAVGAMRPEQQQHVAHMIHTEHGVYLTSWNDKVPRVWVAWWEGELREALTQATKRLYQGVGVHWILFVPGRG